MYDKQIRVDGGSDRSIFAPLPCTRDAARRQDRGRRPHGIRRGKPGAHRSTAPSGEANEFRVWLEDLLKDGDITAKVDMAPGDIVIIPEAFV